MSLKPTGERVIEEFYLNSTENYSIYLFHKATYNFARKFVAGKRVLDYGCGSGYGTHDVAPCCAKIDGVDIDSDAIEYARQHYQAPNLAYQRIEKAELAPLPYPDNEFDAVLSFQVIEHMAETIPYLTEIYRVLKPGGVFICATPDRSTRLFLGQKPWNMWHVHEYDASGLNNLLGNYFQEISIYHMGGKPYMLAPELRRTRKLAWLTLPVTLPFVPENIRVWALKLLKAIAGQGRQKACRSKPAYPFNESDLIISPEIVPSVNLISVAYKEIVN